MVRVMAQGVFDLIHLGHVHYLEKARELGDELVVVVASDRTVRERKHEPITPEEMRRDLVAALRCVDMAVVGSDGDDRYVTVQELKPDIIALGHDQEHDEAKIEGHPHQGRTPRVLLSRPGRDPQDHPEDTVHVGILPGDGAHRGRARHGRGRDERRLGGVSECPSASASQTPPSPGWTWPPMPSTSLR